MKKLLIIMTLFMSSFFLFSLEDVKAYELEYEVDLSLLTDNFSIAKNTMDEFIKNDISYSDRYLLYLYGSNMKKIYAIVFPLDSVYNPNVNIENTYLQLYIENSTLDRFVFSSDYLSSSISGTVSHYQNNVYNTSSSLLFIPLYSNFDILMNEDSFHSTVTYKYNEFTTTNIANGTDKFKTLYMINEEYQSYLNNDSVIHQEELSKVESFYSIVIEKLGYLGETLVSNYIYLSIIVIFILIFVFKLIFRRFL